MPTNKGGAKLRVRLGSFLFVKYSNNTVVSRNTLVFSSLRRLALHKTAFYIVVSITTHFLQYRKKTS